MRATDRLRTLAGWAGHRLTAFSAQVSPRVPGIGLDTYYPHPKASPRAVAVASSLEALEGNISFGAGPTLTRWSTYPANALDPTKIVSILQEADKGFVLRYGDMCLQVLQRDGHLFGVDRSRRVEVSGKPFRVHPANETDLAKSLAHFMAEVVDAIEAFDTSVYSLLSSNCVGYSGSEIIWAPGKISFRGPSGETLEVDGLFPRRLDWVHPKHFHFDIATDAPLLDLGPDGWLELPPLKFIFHLANGDGIASARGFIRPAVWLHLLKHSGLRDWAVFLTLFGIPNIWAKVPREKFEDPRFRAAIEDALRNFGEGRPSILLEDQEVTIQPAQAGGGSNDVHPKLVGFCNAEMSKIVNGETLTTELSQSGSYAASETHEATMHGTVVADGTGIAHSMRGQLFRAVLTLNSQALAKALGHTPEQILRANPKCGHRIEREVTPLQRAQILDIGVNKLGARVGERNFYETFGFDPPAPGENALRGAPVAISSGGAAVGSIDAAKGVTNPKPETPPAEPAA